MKPYPRGLPVLVRRPAGLSPGVVLGVPDEEGYVRVTYFAPDGYPYNSERPLADLAPDLSEPQARSWAREEVARRLGLDVTGGVSMRRTLLDGWRPGGWCFITAGGFYNLTDAPGIDTDDEAAALSAALAHLEER